MNGIVKIAACVLVVGMSLGGVACGTGDEPLCCVEIDPDDPLQALTCEDQGAVTNCMGYDFSDCYRDRARNYECE